MKEIKFLNETQRSLNNKLNNKKNVSKLQEDNL